MKYSDYLAQHARITILRLLVEQPGYEANCAILADALPELGINVGREFVRRQVDWLAEAELVTTRDVGDLVVARASERGLDVAAGRLSVRGVKRPGP
jgi:Fe2+ or Zn2+ uptake regulation protein